MSSDIPGFCAWTFFDKRAFCTAALENQTLAYEGYAAVLDFVRIGTAHHFSKKLSDFIWQYIARNV